MVLRRPNALRTGAAMLTTRLKQTLWCGKHKSHEPKLDTDSEQGISHL
jgi:hypothetical protein